MARKKVADPVGIGSWSEADDVLAELAAHQREVERITLDLNGRVDTLKQNAKTATQAHQAAISTLEKQLAVYAELHKDEIKGKSRELTHGTLGWRQSSALKLGLTVKETVKRLLGAGLTECVRVKDPEVDKTKLRLLSPSELESVGAEIVTKDVFYWEPRTEELPNLEEGVL